MISENCFAKAHPEFTKYVETSLLADAAAANNRLKPPDSMYCSHFTQFCHQVTKLYKWGSEN